MVETDSLSWGSWCVRWQWWWCYSELLWPKTTFITQISSKLCLKLSRNPTKKVYLVGICSVCCFIADQRENLMTCSRQTDTVKTAYYYILFQRLSLKLNKHKNCLQNIVSVMWSCESCLLGAQTLLKSVNFVQAYLSLQLIQNVSSCNDATFGLTKKLLLVHFSGKVQRCAPTFFHWQLSLCVLSMTRYTYSQRRGPPWQ